MALPATTTFAGALEALRCLHERELIGLRDECQRWRERSWQQELEIASLREQIVKTQGQEMFNRSAHNNGPHGSQRLGQITPPTPQKMPPSVDEQILGDFVGVVKTAFEKGYGFISCEELQQDVYVHQRQTADFDAKVGAPVEFQAYLHKERLQGRNLRTPTNQNIKETTQDMVIGDYVGVVKAFNAEKGFGFINCHSVQNEDFKTDVYVHANMAAQFDMQLGAPVLFEAYWHKGRLQGRHLRVPPIDSQEGAHDTVVGEQVGVVKHLSSEKGFGFIACEALNSDIYIHKNNVGEIDFQIGTPVEFQAYWHKGRLQGRRLRIPEGLPNVPQGPPTREINVDIPEDEYLGEHSGIIKDFLPEKGFGFITCDALKDVPQNNGKTDVFLHRNFAGNLPIEIGLEVRFEAYLQKGQIQAKSISKSSSSKRALARPTMAPTLKRQKPN